ncbi:MAG: ribosome maturation factor RimP [Pseudomonadota bacterium]
MARGKAHRTGDDKNTPSRPVTKLKDDDIVRQVDALVAPFLAADGIELVLVEYRRESGGRIMRLYIDKPGGVMLDDCVSVNRYIGDLLDVSLGDIGPYRLEVSSPGTDRPLVKPEDFKRFERERVQIRLKTPVQGRKNIKGQLTGSDADGISVETDAETLCIRYSQISMARLFPQTKP